MEGKQADRNIKIINTTQSASGSNLKKLLFDIDQIEIQRMQGMKLTEDKMAAAEG